MKGKKLSYTAWDSGTGVFIHKFRCGIRDIDKLKTVREITIQNHSAFWYVVNLSEEQSADFFKFRHNYTLGTRIRWVDSNIGTGPDRGMALLKALHKANLQCLILIQLTTRSANPIPLEVLKNIILPLLYTKKVLDLTSPYFKDIEMNYAGKRSRLFFSSKTEPMSSVNKRAEIASPKL